MRVVVPRVFTSGEIALGLLWVFLLCKDTRRDFQGFAHRVHSHLYHRRLVQKASDSERVFYAHVVSMAVQRAGQQGTETWDRLAARDGAAAARLSQRAAWPFGSNCGLGPHARTALGLSARQNICARGPGS